MPWYWQETSLLLLKIYQLSLTFFRDKRIGITESFGSDFPQAACYRKRSRLFLHIIINLL